MLTAINVAVGMENLGLLSEGENQRPPDGDHTQRLVRDV
jgi:hypothetical protein